MCIRDSYNTAFTELQAGALDALAIDIGVAKYQINSRGEGFMILDESLNTEQMCIRDSPYSIWKQSESVFRRKNRIWYGATA